MKNILFLLIGFLLISGSVYAGNVSCGGGRCTDSDYYNPVAKAPDTSKAEAGKKCEDALTESEQSQEEPEIKRTSSN